MLHSLWDLSFPTRDGTCFPCIGRWNLNHLTTREVPHCGFNLQFSIMINVAEHLVLCLLTICRSPLETCLFGSSECFVIELFVFLTLSHVSCLCLDTNSSVVSFRDVFLFNRLSFHFADGFLFCAKLLSLIRFHLFVIACIFFVLGVKKNIAAIYVKEYSAYDVFLWEFYGLWSYI